MKRTTVLILFGALAVPAVLLRGEIRFWTLLFLTRPIGKQIVQKYCDGNESCMWDLRGTVDRCARLGVGQAESLFVSADARKNQFCLQRELADRSCRQEEKCLAYVEALYEKCFTQVFAEAGNLVAPNAPGAIKSCIDTKSYLVDIPQAGTAQTSAQAVTQARANFDRVRWTQDRGQLKSQSKNLKK